MRSDGEFLKDLRAEISATQQRRDNYVRMKLGAVVGIFGFGSIKSASLASNSVLFLIPLVVFVFDLFIAGQDFAIKRAGRFILMNPNSPEEERRWERNVRAVRNSAAPLAHLVTSILFLAIAALYLRDFEASHFFCYWGWLAFSCVFLFASWIYEHALDKRLKKVDEFLEKEFAPTTAGQEPASGVALPKVRRKAPKTPRITNKREAGR